MSDNDSSSLSTPPSSDDELQKPTVKTLSLKKGKLVAAPSRKKNAPAASSPESSPQRATRAPSPPHDYVLADNPSIAVIIMFRSRFFEAFPKHVPNLGPQDIEIGVSEPEPSEQMEHLMCALLGLVLNRKKYVERGHHGRALEEAIQSQKHQWPIAWGGENPLHGNRTFSTMDATERITLLKTLVDWSLTSSEVIGTLIKESYKQTRHDDDLNQPRSVQPWGIDGRKRRYWLIEGQNDTTFRLYRENPTKLVNRTWWSIAGTIDELKAVGEELQAEGSQAARRLADRIMQSIPRLEQSEDKRKRREYRLTRKAAFTRPEPGFSLYEGRTRGKRMRYTFSDDEDEGSDVTSVRRSARHSNRSTPAEPDGPTVTASGRHVRSKYARPYSDRVQERTGSVSDAGNGSENSTNLRGGEARVTRSSRARQNGRPSRRTHTGDYNSVGDSEDEEEAASTGEKWSGNDDDITGRFDDEADEDEGNTSDNESVDSMDYGQPRTLVVRLKLGKGSSQQASSGPGHSDCAPILGIGLAEIETGLDRPSRGDSEQRKEPTSDHAQPGPAVNLQHYPSHAEPQTTPYPPPKALPSFSYSPKDLSQPFHQMSVVLPPSHHQSPPYSTLNVNKGVPSNGHRPGSLSTTSSPASHSMNNVNGVAYTGQPRLAAANAPVQLARLPPPPHQ